MKQKRSLGHKQKISFKHFVNLFSISKVTVKSNIDPDETDILTTNGLTHSHLEFL